MTPRDKNSAAQVVTLPIPGVVTLENGRDYRTVALRLKYFRQDHPDWRILPTIHEITSQSVIFRAEILDATNRLIATGHAEEIRSASAKNRVAAVPIGETSAVGRALFNLGYVPTDEELQPVMIDDEEYQKVAARILAFRREYPAFTLKSEILHHTSQIFLIRAVICDDQGFELACGHVEEVRSGDPEAISHLNVLEQAETSAWGRCLAFFKFHGTQLATADEVLAARRRAGASSEKPTQSSHVSRSDTPPVDHVTGLITSGWPEPLAKAAGAAVRSLALAGFTDMTFRQGEKRPGNWFVVEPVPQKGVRLKAKSFANQGALVKFGFVEDTADKHFYLRFPLEKFAAP
jgi:hypothetical protein